ncbi:hypothetical protein BJV82DRAFT_673109 [Fennellomyces sp. T-0311]|nr:hypothetical protein BJV82DRAFT_673109 [Fennellomyces sp. T-0311]
MLLRQPRTVFHLRITPSTVVRVILQIDQTKIQWYNENAFHPEVLKALQSVLMEHLVSDTHRKGIARRKKELEKTRVPSFDSRIASVGMTTPMKA